MNPLANNVSECRSDQQQTFTAGLGRFTALQDEASRSQFHRLIGLAGATSQSVPLCNYLSPASVSAFGILPSRLLDCKSVLLCNNVSPASVSPFGILPSRLLDCKSVPLCNYHQPVCLLSVYYLPGLLTATSSSERQLF
jgi:hypothetical protein